jgi:DNA polymerase sigma
MTTAIDRAKEHSERTLEKLRNGLTEIVPAKEVVLTCGSYARREASEESDIDFFVIMQQAGALDKIPAARAFPWLDRAKDAIAAVVPIEPAEGGAFSKVE